VTIKNTSAPTSIWCIQFA